jgi:predicted nucleic acid-binding protein
MSKYILDTGILLGYIRGVTYAEFIEKEFKVSEPPNIPLISVVSIGEIYSLSLKFNWGNDKKEKLEELIRKIPYININHHDILNMYAEIDAYSHSHHPHKKLPTGMSARNIGKNDIWIAATAAVSFATLLTTDKDFDHLNKVFLNVEYIDPKMK